MITKLHTIFLNSNGISTDTRKIKKGSIFFALKGENFNANEFALEALEKGASYAVIDEKKYHKNDKTLLVNNVLKTLQQLATYHREQLKAPIIALTGSNGKTTTKELIKIVLSNKYKVTATSGNLNNHIGVPLTLLSMNENTEIGVVEFGANNPKEIEFLANLTKPDYGYITNFGKAHLEGFKSLEGVIKAKTELYDYLKENKKIVFVNDNDATQVLKSKKLKTIRFGEKKSEYYIEFINSNPFVTVKYNKTTIKTNLIGSYNYNNITAAIAIGLYFDIDILQIKIALENYEPSNNRSQIIQKNSNKIILDAYNANPTSMECAIQNLIQLKDTSKIAILGDMFELGKYAKEEHQEITNLLKISKLNKAYLIGENFYETIADSKNIKKFKTFKEFKQEFEAPTNTTILIKASRSMALERVLDLI